MEKTTSQSLDDVRLQAEFDRHMSMARVSRMRGDYAQAAESVRLALKVKPEDPEAMEFAADVLAARGEVEKAIEIYKGLHQADPSRVAAEEKFARLTIQMAEGKRQQNLLKEIAENPEKYRNKHGSRSPLMAALASSAPGFGQIYCGQFVKGAVLFVSVMICWFFFRLLAPDVSLYPAGERLTRFAQEMSPMGIVFALIAICLHVYAFVDAPVYASKLNNEENKSYTEPNAP